MLSRKLWPSLVLLLATLSGSGVLADQRNFGAMRSRDYDDRGGYYPPRHQQPVLPTRPFFVQPYPRRQLEQEDNHAYRHGYQEGYGDGYSDRAGHQGRHHGRDERYGGSYQSPNDYQQPNYYGPRPGASIYYNNR